MTSTTVVIHYKSPKNDPFKVPRPHRITIDETGAPSQPTGGEIGPIRSLIGFSKTQQPKFDRGTNWWLPEDLYDGDVMAHHLTGWYACFDNENGPFTAVPAIEKVEVV